MSERNKPHFGRVKNGERAQGGEAAPPLHGTADRFEFSEDAREISRALDEAEGFDRGPWLGEGKRSK